MQVTSSIQIADNTWPRSKPKEASILMDQLEKLWKSCRTVKQHHDIKKSNEMLIKLLEIIIREKITKPDWRSIFVKHIHALSYSGKSKIAFYYFQIASQIFKEMTPSYLVKLLSKGPPLETPNTDEYLKFLKLDYRIVFYDSEDTSFAEKLMINICQFFVKDQDSSINPQEIFKHYMMCLTADDLALKLRLKKLALVAFQSQCYYCIKNIKKMSRIELNLYKILELLLNLYGSETIQKQEYLYRSVSNFISLMRTEILQNFILHNGKSIRVPQIVQKFINLIDSLETQDPVTYKNNYLQKIAISLLHIKHLTIYINVNHIKQFPQTKKQGVYWMLSFHQILTRIQPEHFSLFPIDQVEKKINFVCSQWKGDTDQIISCFLRDVSLAINDQVFPIVNKIGLPRFYNIDEKQAKKFMKWTQLLELGLFFIEKMNNNNENFISQSSSYFEYLLYSLLLKYILQNKHQKTRQDLLHFMKKKYGPFLRNIKVSSFQYINMMYTLNCLALTQDYQIAYDIISHFFECIDPKILIAEPQFYNAVVPFRFINRFKQIKRQTIKQRLFFMNTIELYIRNLSRTIVNEQTYSTRSECRLLLSQLIGLIGEYYSFWKDNILEQLLDMLVGVQNQFNEHIFLNTISIICRQTLALIKEQIFCQEESYREVLINYLDFFKDVLSKKPTLTVQEKIDIVDFTFNVKTQLFVIFKKINLRDKNFVSFIQEMVDFVDQIEYKFLDRSASEYINHLRHILQDDKNASLSLVAAVAVKHIFYIVNPNCQSCSFIPQHKDKDEGSQQYDFIYDEIQMTTFKLKQIKKNCLSFQKIFENMIFQHAKLPNGWNDYTIAVKDDEVLPLCGYLHDLTYLGFLSGVNSFKKMMISFRLSIILRYVGLQIYTFQIARLIMLQILTVEEQQQMRAYLNDLNSPQSAIGRPSNYQMITMMLKGNISEELFSNSRIFRILYYLNQSPLVYISNFKQIFQELIYQIFNFKSTFYEAGQAVVLKMSKSQRAKDKRFEKWIKQCWYEDWSHLRIMIIFLRKIIKQSLALNQTSRLRSLLKFTLAMHIRSGHLDELSLPLQVLIIKKKDINFMRIADSLRQIVKSDIDPNEDKKLDRILCDKRKSVSFGLKMQSFGKMINKAYEKAGPIGYVLRDIIFYLVCDTLSINQWQKIKTMLQMPIYSQNNTIVILKKFRLRGEETIDAQILNANMLCKQISSLLFHDFKAAAALRDYIAGFIDFAMENSNSLSRQHSQQIDNLIVTLCLLFEEFNYTLKQFWGNNSYELSIIENDLQKIACYNTQLLQKYSQLQNIYFRLINEKILQQNTIPWPMNIIFPLGSFVYNIACQGSLLITYVRKTDFEDKFEVVKDILISNKQLLSPKNINTANNYRKRKGLDDQFGKVVSSTDIGIIDSDIRIFSSNLINDLIKIHSSLMKFLPFQKSYIHHLQNFIKRYKLGSFELIKHKLLLITYTLSGYKPIHDNLVLYIHQKYLTFPFECINSVKNYAVFRVPSVHYIKQTENSSHNFNIQNCKYLIDTKNNLPLTATKFQAVKQKYNSKHWTGIVGRVPPLQQMIHLFERDIFLYMGHGTGMEHLPSTQYINFRPKCLMLVFGCSSALMIYEQSQPFGCSFDFLLRGCPAYLGCLWEITDVDTDIVTEYLIMNSTNENLASVLGRARSKCYFPYLNTASMVIYGLPCSIHHTKMIS